MLVAGVQSSPSSTSSFPSPADTSSTLSASISGSLPSSNNLSTITSSSSISSSSLPPPVKTSAPDSQPSVSQTHSTSTSVLTKYSASFLQQSFLRGNSSSSSSGPSRRPSLRNLRRSSRNFGSLALLSRLSSAAVSGAVLPTQPNSRAGRHSVSGASSTSEAHISSPGQSPPQQKKNRKEHKFSRSVANYSTGAPKSLVNQEVIARPVEVVVTQTSSSVPVPVFSDPFVAKKTKPSSPTEPREACDSSTLFQSSTATLVPEGNNLNSRSSDSQVELLPQTTPSSEGEVTSVNSEIIPEQHRGIATARAANHPAHHHHQHLHHFSSSSMHTSALADLPSIEPDKKMHQTSSRLLRMTDDDRPFTRDFKDLFSTLMVSLPLNSHRVRFQRIDHTFTSDEAITNLGSLKFSQSNRMPDPKDPSRIVTTTTTTTFSMLKEMARSVCTKFLEARFVESIDGKGDFHSKSAVWQLTAKGMCILQGFCQRNGITSQHVMELLDTPRNNMHLVILERESETDKIHRDQATIEVVFRRFVGVEGPNLKTSTVQSDSDSVSDYQTGLIGVKMAQQRKIGDKTYWNTFTGKAAIDWLMDCCMMVDRRETVELASLFVEHGLMASLETLTGGVKFSPSKNAVYKVTDKGKRVAGWINDPKMATNGNDPASRTNAAATRDSNANRMTVIIRDPALRLLFHEFLRDTHCEENLSFYLDVREFLNTYNAAKKSSPTPRLEVVRETLAAAYSLYNAFLAPGSPCELNIDHSLRTALAARMTRAVGDDDAMIKSLDEVATLFDQAQHSVFKLMASDSVPKFMREPRYAQVLRERNLDVALGGPMTGAK